MSFADRRQSRYTVTAPTPQILAAGMVLVTMWAFYWSSNGLAGMGDWSAYRLMYNSGADYLSRRGRDPGFVWLISAAAWAFGYDGYETFRTVLFSIFTLVAARWAYLARGLTPVTALTIFATLIVKSTVQIREGVAFVLLAWPLIGLYVQRPIEVVRRPRTAFAALVGAASASLTHFGTSIFLGVWLGAAFFTLIPRNFLAWRYTPRALLLFGLGVGLSLGGVIIAFPQPFESLAVYLAGGVYSTPHTFLLKTIYWLTLGLLTFGVGHQLVKAAQGCSPFGYAYAVVLGRFALPLICSVCIFLVVSAFSIIQVTEWGNRLLASLLELALILITVRGRANYLTLLMALILLANAARSFVPYWGLDPPV